MGNHIVKICFLLMTSIMCSSVYGTSIEVSDLRQSRYKLTYYEFKSEKKNQEYFIINFNHWYDPDVSIQTPYFICPPDLPEDGEPKAYFAGKKIFLNDKLILYFNLDSQLPHYTPWHQDPLILISISGKNDQIESDGICTIKINRAGADFI